MLNLTDAIILNSKAPDKEVNVTFDKGLTVLSYNQRYLYEFLKLTNQALDKGTFSVNGNSIVPLEDKKDSLFMLSISSQDIVVSACYLLTQEQETKGVIAAIKDEERRSKIKAIQEEFIAIKGMPLENEEDHLAKVRAIWEALVRTNPAYVLLNFNNDVNKASKSLLDGTMSKYSSSLTIIALEASNKEKKPFFAFLKKEQKKETAPKQENVPLYTYSDEEIQPSKTIHQETPLRIEEPRPQRKEKAKKNKDIRWHDITID